jgi:hypothetical protein
LRATENIDPAMLRTAHALGPLADPRQVDRLRGILDAKSHASYSGSFYTLQDGRDILQEPGALRGVGGGAAGEPSAGVARPQPEHVLNRVHSSL